MKQLVALVMIAFLVPATATVAFAKNACKEEKAKFCKDAKAAGKKVNDCLKEHIAEVSPACKEQLEKPKEPKTDKEKADEEDKEGQKARGQANRREARRDEARGVKLRRSCRDAALQRLHHLALQRASVTIASRRAVAMAARQHSSFRLRA